MVKALCINVVAQEFVGSNWNDALRETQLKGSTLVYQRRESTNQTSAPLHSRRAAFLGVARTLYE